MRCFIALFTTDFAKIGSHLNNQPATALPDCHSITCVIAAVPNLCRFGPSRHKSGTSKNPIAVSVPLSGQIGIEMNNERLHCTFHYRFHENRHSFEHSVRQRLSRSKTRCSHTSTQKQGRLLTKTALFPTYLNSNEIVIYRTGLFSSSG